MHGVTPVSDIKTLDIRDVREPRDIISVEWEHVGSDSRFRFVILKNDGRIFHSEWSRAIVSVTETERPVTRT